MGADEDTITAPTPPAGGRPRGRRRLLVWVGAVVLVAVIVAVAFALTRSGQSSSDALAACGSRCSATVRVTRRSPRVIVFFGKACATLRGAWFLNAVEGGGGDAVRPVYYLKWSFPPKSNDAKPGGTISVTAGAGANVAMTLDNGTLNLTGNTPGHPPVSGTGQLAIRLTGSGDKPKLTFTETGLTTAEDALGVLSPFNINGRPLTLPVTIAHDRSGC